MNLLKISINNPFQINTPQTWYLAWGEVAVLSEATLQDEHLAIFCPNES